MVELQIVVLAVAGSSPVGHPCALREFPNPESQAPTLIFDHWDLALGPWDFPPSGGVACPLLKNGFMLNPAVIDTAKVHATDTNFWIRILNNEELQGSDNLEKLVVGCEIIAALDAVDLLAA
jgi:hypothetical protein